MNLSLNNGMIDLLAVMDEADIVVTLGKIAALRQDLATQDSQVLRDLHDRMVERAQRLGALLRVRPDLGC
jgi:hypothetical protein